MAPREGRASGRLWALPHTECADCYGAARRFSTPPYNLPHAPGATGVPEGVPHAEEQGPPEGGQGAPQAHPEYPLQNPPRVIQNAVQVATTSPATDDRPRGRSFPSPEQGDGLWADCWPRSRSPRPGPRPKALNSSASSVPGPWSRSGSAPSSGRG